MTEGTVSSNNNIDERCQALLNNAGAARALSRLVEGTIGPKGLDTMLVDRFGDVAISNDGVTILQMVEVQHPAARIIVNAARTQHEQAGDGTTTATILAGALVAAGVEQILRGVPVTRILEGIDIGIQEAVDLLKKSSRPINSLQDQRLFDIARIAGRGHKDLALLVMEGARLVGEQMLEQPEYRLSEAVISREHMASRVFQGVLITREPLNREMPVSIEDVRLMVFDDALSPEELGHDSLKSDAGIQYFLEARQRYEKNLEKICQLGVNLVLVDRSIDGMAEQIFTENGILALQQVSARDLEQICRHTGARKLKCSALNREPVVLEKNIGRAFKVECDEKFRHTCIYGGSGAPWATILVGAATEEIVDERERMARDAAAALQVALAEGVVPGGGAIEVWMADRLGEMARGIQDMSSYGVLCVKEALTKPFCCMAANAGFNPLEKLGEVTARQAGLNSDRISFDCESGALIDMEARGILDPTGVKRQALLTAGQVAIAVLRINTIIRMKDEESKRVRQDILE